MSKLKPCPFCGNANVGITREYDADGFGVFLSIKCRECHGQSPQVFATTGNDCPETYASCRASWNGRPEASAPKAPSFELTVIIEAGQLLEEMIIIGVVNGVHAAELSAIEEDLFEAVEAEINLADYPDDCHIEMVATNFQYQPGQQSCPESGLMDFNECYEMDLSVVSFIPTVDDARINETLSPDDKDGES